MTVTYIVENIFPIAFNMLPEKMNSKEAQALLISIGLQESRFTSRRQIGGPANGFWQFEKGGGCAGVLKHYQTGPILLPILQTMCYGSTPEDVYQAIEHNDILAVIMARLLLWTVPGKIPGRGEPEASWRQYLNGWRPGKPHRATWDGFNQAAWKLLSQ